jgi:hypothetical protein
MSTTEVPWIRSYLIHEYEGDEGGKVLFGESCDVTDESRGVKCHEENQNATNPEPNPESEFQIV